MSMDGFVRIVTDFAIPQSQLFSSPDNQRVGKGHLIIVGKGHDDGQEDCEREQEPHSVRNQLLVISRPWTISMDIIIPTR